MKQPVASFRFFGLLARDFEVLFGFIWRAARHDDIDAGGAPTTAIVSLAFAVLFT